MNALLKPLEMAFRPMRAEDLDALIKIERAAYPYPWTLGNFRDCLESGYSCWVGEVEGALSGYWVMMLAAGEGHILNCCLAPAWQRRGFGRTLVEHLGGRFTLDSTPGSGTRATVELPAVAPGMAAHA